MFTIQSSQYMQLWWRVTVSPTIMQFSKKGRLIFERWEQKSEIRTPIFSVESLKSRLFKIPRNFLLMVYQIYPSGITKGSLRMIPLNHDGMEKEKISKIHPNCRLASLHLLVTLGDVRWNFGWAMKQGTRVVCRVYRGWNTGPSYVGIFS